MSKKARTLVLSMVTACLCLALIVGATYALFSDMFTVNNHLKAGKLEVGLERIGYTACTLGDDGTLTESEDPSVVDLVDDGSTLFQMDTIVPGSWYEAKLRVRNNGDVAFDYGVRVLWNENADANEKQLALASQIQITVTQGDTQKAQFMLDEAVDVDFAEPVLAESEADSDTSQTFTVRAEFVDDTANNEAQGAEKFEFDLQVYATQITQQ